MLFIVCVKRNEHIQLGGTETETEWERMRVTRREWGGGGGGRVFPG